MATKDQLHKCHRIMDLCALLSAQKVGIFGVTYAGIADSLSVSGYEIQEYEGQSLTYIDGWTSVDEGNTIYLGDWYERNCGQPGECIARLDSLAAKLYSLLDRDEDGVPI